jgi:1-acyl-sn-glycerol-3-phosphate acyltransferase
LSLLGRLWRSAATVLCFAVFALGGLLLAPVLLLALLLQRDGVARRRWGKRAVHHSFRAFVALMRWVGVVRVSVEPGLRAQLREGGRFVVANHPTLIDFVVLASLCPQADCLVKGALFRDPTRQWPVRLAGYIRNEDGEQTLALAARSFAEGNSLFIFPEGTRTRPGEAPQFQKGAAQLAVRLGRDVLPLYIRATPSNLHKGAPFYWAPAQAIRMAVEALAPVAVGPFLERRGGEAALAARDLNQHLQGLYQEL